jgi:FixJ family two-component response regulator
LADLRERIGSPSLREREIMIHVARRRLGKQIAGRIGIAEATVKVPPQQAMWKMNFRTLPELGRMADRVKLVSRSPDLPNRADHRFLRLLDHRARAHCTGL